MRAGEADVNNQYDTTIVAGESRRYSDGGLGKGLGMGALLRCAAIWLALAFAFAAALVPVTARAQQKITFANARTVTVTVTVGKSQDIHTDQSLVDIMVGDPDVAIFDIEVSYDVSRLSAEIAHFTGGGIKVSSIDGRIMLSGTSPDAVTLDKAVTIGKQFAPDIINPVQVTQPQQIMLEVRFIEASRQAGQELGVQWNVFGNRVLANVGNNVPAAQLPITAPNGSFQQTALSGAGIGGLNVPPSATTISPIVAAGVLSGASPVGFLIGRPVGGEFPVRRRRQ